MTAQAQGSQLHTDDLSALAAEAFIYGFPLVFDLQEVERFTSSGMGALAPAPLNVFSHADALAGPKDTFVSINNDTIYSIAKSTSAAGRCAWRSLTPTAATTCCSSSMPGRTTSPTSAVARLGRRPGRFCWSPPDWDGATPDGATVIRFPTTVAIDRRALGGRREDDLPAVRALQHATDADPDRRRRTDVPGPDPAVPEDARVLRATARLASGVPAGGARPRLPAAIRAAGLVRHAIRRTRTRRPNSRPRCEAVSRPAGSAWNRPSSAARARGRTAGS